MGKKIIFTFLIIVAGFLGQVVPVHSQSEDVFNNSGLEIPRFVSLRSNKVFVRTGPALRYPIKWVYKRESLPVEITQEFDTWRKIKDHDGEEGWIHQSLLSGRRHAVITNEDGAYLLKKPESTSKRVALLESSSVVSLKECSPLWCKAEIKGFSGWIERNLLWGVYQDEELD